MNNKTINPRPARSLATTLAVAFFTLSAIILLVNGGFSLYTNYLIYSQGFAAQQQLTAQNAAKTVSDFFTQLFDHLETAVEFANPVTATPVARKSVMDSLLGLDSAFGQFALLDSRGNPLSLVSRTTQTISPQFALQLKDAALTKGAKDGRYIGSVYIDDATSEPQIVLAIPVKSVLGDFQGILATEVNLKFMWNLVDQLKVGQTGYAYVVDVQGNLLAFQDTTRVLAGENVKQNIIVKNFVNNPNELTNATQEIESHLGLLGTDVVGTYAPLGTPEWAVVIELPWAEAIQPLFQGAMRSILAVLVLAALAALMGVFVARRLSAPLVNLSNVAGGIGSGNLDLQAKVAGPAEIAKVAASFNTMTSRLRDLISNLEEHVADRTKALKISRDVSYHISTIHEKNELVAEVVNGVRDAFDYYHTQIYFYDEDDENLVMAGGTGRAGELMLAQFHKIAKGRGLVGRAAEIDETILVTDTTKNPEWLPNPLLPETKSEAAIPISIGGKVLGVLDVQHNIVNGLHEESVDGLVSIANQVAVALQNIKSTEGAIKRAAELQTVARISTVAATISDSQKMLESVVHLTQRGFDLYHAHVFLYNENTAELAITACGYKEGDIHEGTHGTAVIPLGQEQSLVARAGRTRQAVIVNNVHNEPGWLPNPLLPDTASELAVPLIVGNQLLGVLDVQSERINAFTDEDASIQSTLASQISVALQNTRSYSEAQRQAERETAVNLITQKIQNTTSVEAALQIAARELGHALGMKQTLVELDPVALTSEQKSHS